MKDMYPKVEWCEKFGGNYLRFQFGSKLTRDVAEKAIVKWKNAFDQKKKMRKLI